MSFETPYSYPQKYIARRSGWPRDGTSMAHLITTDPPKSHSSESIVLTRHAWMWSP